MPNPIGYTGNQYDYQTNSVFSLPIESSIREGEFLVSSIHKEEATEPKLGSYPVEVIPPSIVFEDSILSVFTGVWESHPSVGFAFEWEINSVTVSSNSQYTVIESDYGKTANVTINILHENSVHDTKTLSYVLPDYPDTMTDCEKAKRTIVAFLYGS